ncbi:hypothetical protein DPMN_149067 [Dreissena polymorpha]|uniref:Uncharacterized protein n=1 Tax=Dreissena polymorpha TaxID=45954 RepID=A0A9D4FGR1_DREPO|nr:hypothetical protein DPMN_149067 [Dreissena polymorpha]
MKFKQKGLKGPKKNAQTPGGHIFPLTRTIFELIQYIIGTIRLTNVYDDRTINVAYSVNKEKCPPPLVAMFFKTTETIFELIQDSIGTYLLTKVHEDRKIIKMWPLLRVLTRVYYSHTRKNAPPHSSHVFQPTCIIF